MQYLDLINNFWRIDEQKGFNGNETRLYFFLLHLANRSFWNIEWLEYGDERAKAMLGISSVVLRTAREKLKEALLIDFITGGRGYRVKTRYKILTPNLQSNPIPNPDPLYNKTKTKNKITQSDNFYNEKNGRKYSQREFIASGSDFDE